MSYFLMHAYNSSYNFFLFFYYQKIVKIAQNGCWDEFYLNLTSNTFFTFFYMFDYILIFNFLILYFNARNIILRKNELKKTQKKIQKKVKKARKSQKKCQKIRKAHKNYKKIEFLKFHTHFPLSFLKSSSVMIMSIKQFQVSTKLMIFKIVDKTVSKF